MEHVLMLDGGESYASVPDGVGGENGMSSGGSGVLSGRIRMTDITTTVPTRNSRTDIARTVARIGEQTHDLAERKASEFGTTMGEISEEAKILE